MASKFQPARAQGSARPFLANRFGLERIFDSLDKALSSANHDEAA
jgi:hypothetical protein